MVLLMGFLLGFSVASAFCLRDSCVAPVRGGTYFLCFPKGTSFGARSKESKERKRAHTASACFYPRALNVPVLHAATLSRTLVANASNGCITHFKHPFDSKPYQTLTAALRQTMCRTSCRKGNHRSARGHDSVRKLVRQDDLHTVCRKWAATDQNGRTLYGYVKRVRRLSESIATHMNQ